MLFNFSTWVPEVLTNGSKLSRDIIAGVTIAMIIIPQSMAYASLAGVPPIYGLYASLIPVAIAALFGSSRYLATGPVAMVCLLTSVAVGSLAAGNTEFYVYFAVLLSFSVGIFQLFLSFIKAGRLFDEIPENVLLGFTSAAALIIATSQLSKVFGLPKVAFSDLFNISEFLNNSPMSGEAVLLSIFLLVLMYVLKYKYTKYMTFSNLAVFFAVVISILFSTFFYYQGPIVGFIPPGLPEINIPTFDILDASLPMFLIHTVIITFVGFMEAIAIAKQLYIKKPPKDDKGVELYKDPTPVNSDQELFGQGLSNMSSGLSGTIPVSGSFSRSAVNEASGAFSGIASVITMVIVAFTLLYATPLLFNLPQATLGIIVIFAVLPLIRIKKMKDLYNNNWELGSVAWITFFSTLMFPLFSFELFEGVRTHIWTGIVFGFIIHLIFKKIFAREES